MAHPFHYDDNEITTILEMDYRDLDRAYCWDLAEADARRSTHRDCPECDGSRGRYCDVHRCAAVSSTTGERCKRGITADDNPLHCGTHVCGFLWVSDGERIGCSSQGTMRDLPDGSRARVCDHHHGMLKARAA